MLRLFPKPAERVTCMAGLTALETAPDFFARVLGRAGPALTAFEIMPRIGLDFVLRHGSAVRDPFASPHPWYVLFELTSPREGEELLRLAESVLGEGIEAGEIDSAVVASSLGAGAGAVAPARADERGAEARGRQHQARRRRAGGARAGVRRRAPTSSSS